MTKDSLTDKVLRMLECADRDPSVPGEIFGLIKEAPENGERDGLMALALHEGIGVPVDLDKSFRFAEKAAFKGGDALGYYILGYMRQGGDTRPGGRRPTPEIRSLRCRAFLREVCGKGEPLEKLCL